MDALQKQLQEILDKVQSEFTYVTDKEQYGIDEKWVMPSPSYDGNMPIKGDCEDFALACRKLCREAGIPTRLVVCTLLGEGHCVLEANGWIFDNNNSSIKSRDDLEATGDYVWYYISGFNPRDDWRLIVKDK